MLTNDITLNTSDTYSLIEQRPTSSKRSISGLEPNVDGNLVVSHEVAKDGRVSSVVIIEDLLVPAINATTGIIPKTDAIRVMLKLQYSPSTTRVSSDADIKKAIAGIVEFFGDPVKVNKILNREH